jgi:beta-fructofuranosidase
MWYTAGYRVGPEDWRASIAEATSDDGLVWNDPKNLETDVVPVLQAGTPGVDEEGVETISVVRAADGEYRMYYAGARAVTPNVAYVIGLATSQDGKVWTKRPAPVLSPTLPWEAAFEVDGVEVGGACSSRR